VIVLYLSSSFLFDPAVSIGLPSKSAIASKKSSWRSLIVFNRFSGSKLAIDV